MDAFQRTRPVLSHRIRVEARPRRTGFDAGDTDAAFATARRFVQQLPLGSAPAPYAGRVRARFGEALAELDAALHAVALRSGVIVEIKEDPAAIARRLVRARAIVPPAADAVAAVVPVLRAGVTGELEDASVEPSFGKLAERIAGYLRSRAGARRR